MTLKPNKPPVVAYESTITSGCIYDPIDPNYIYKSKPPSKKTYLFFGYNGNYPENQITALKNRGCWKFLDYQEAIDLAQSKYTRGRRKADEPEKPSNQRHNQKGFPYRFLLAMSLKQTTS